MRYRRILSLSRKLCFNSHLCFPHFPLFPPVSRSYQGCRSLSVFPLFPCSISPHPSPKLNALLASPSCSPPQSSAFCPEDGDLSLGSNGQRYKRKSLKKVFYLTSTPPYWITAIDRMVWFNRTITFSLGALGLPFWYSHPSAASQNWFLWLSKGSRGHCC